MSIPTLVLLLDAIGVVAFAITGALVASRQRMDITGFALLAIVTGVGGGTLRDVLLGALPVTWLLQPLPVALCVVVACAVFAFAHVPRSRYAAVLWLDALGLAVFCTSGARVALEHEASAFAAIVMGVITATFGGIIRDVIGGEASVILRREIYVTAALLGAGVFVALEASGLAEELAAVGGFAAAFSLRALAIARHWSLPRYRERGAVTDSRPYPD